MGLAYPKLKPKPKPQQQLILTRETHKENINRILFLGTADSGKTTLMNQIKFLEHNFTEIIDDKNKIKIVVTRLLDIIINCLEINPYDIYDCEPHANNQHQFIQDIIDNKISFEYFLKEKYKDKFLKEQTFTKIKENCNKLSSEDNVEYLFNNLERILIKNEITELDYLSCYNKTTGILVYKTLQNNIIVSPGGFRNERKKWVHILTLVIFVSLSEFNQICYEDDITNRLQESLLIFGEIFNNRWFKNVNTILVFTKVDCFIKKINSGIKFSNYFNDFNGNDNNPKEVFEFIVEQFRVLCRGKELMYCALNCLDKFECLKVKEIIENIQNYKCCNEVFISNLLLINGKYLNQMFTKLIHSVVNLTYCDIEIIVINKD